MKTLGAHILRGLAAIGTALALAACGGSDDTSAGPVLTDPTAPGPVARIEMLPAGGMLVDTTEQRAVSVKAFDANGLEVPVAAADVNLVSSDAAGIEVSRSADGFALRATAVPRSAVLTASVGTVNSKPAVFYSAQPVAGAITVADAQVRSEPVAVDPAAPKGLGFQTRVTLAGVGSPAVGSIVVGTGTQPVGGRVVSASANAGDPALTDVVLELVQPAALFDTLRMDLAFSVAEMNQLLELPSGVRTGASVGRKRPMLITGAGCEGDGPALSALTGELEARVDPRLSSQFVLDIASGAVQKARVLVTGGLDVSGKAVLNLGAAVTGGVACKATLGAIPIPITGPLAPLIAPVIPLNAKLDLGALVQVNLFTFSAEFKQSAEFDFGFDYDTGRPVDSQLQSIKRLEASDPTFTRNVSFPTAASLRVKATAFVGLSSGLDVGNRAARLELIELFAGPEFEAKFGGSYDVATDTIYTSEYELKVKAGIGPGGDISAAIERVLGSAKALDMAAKVERSIAKTPGAASMSTEKPSFAAGEDVVFDVELNPASVEFPLVGYNVKEVRIYRLRHGGSTSAELVATAVAFDGQTSFHPLWVADEAGKVYDDIAGKPNFYAFVVDKPLALVSGFFPFELGPVSAKDSGTQGLIAGGGTQSVAIDGAGRVVSWGTDFGGALGRDNASNLPNFVDGLPAGVKAKAVAAGAWHAVAVLENGKVYAWGYGGTVGRATGFGGQAEVPTAQVVTLDRGVIATAVATRYNHTLVLDSTGAVWGFGPNRNGALGPYSSFLDGYVVGIAIDQVKAIAAGGEHSLALRNDGTVWAWGSDVWGQVAAGGSTTSPTQVIGLPPIKAIAAASAASFALDEAGNVWSWGSVGMLGRPGSAVPARIGSLSGVTAIAAGDYNAFALMSDGTVKAWGDNLYGRVGVAREDGIPATIPGLADVIEVNGAEFHGMALTRSGAVYAWGRNELKTINGTDSPTQSDVPMLSGFFR